MKHFLNALKTRTSFLFALVIIAIFSSSTFVYSNSILPFVLLPNCSVDEAALATEVVAYAHEGNATESTLKVLSTSEEPELCWYCSTCNGHIICFSCNCADVFACSEAVRYLELNLIFLGC